MSKLILVDAHSNLHRAYHALPPLTTSKGETVNAIYGFTRMLLKLLKEHRPDYVAICFDAPGPTFRDKIYPEYKATRKETDEALRSQFPLSRELVDAMGLASFEKEGFEADDLIATLAKKGESKGLEVLIVSSDKDVLQIVNPHIKVLNEPKQILFDSKKVQERWGVQSEQIIDVLALMGDHSDNVPGVQGIGEKTAIKLIADHGSVEKILQNPDGLSGKLKEKIIQSVEQIKKSKELVILKSDVPVTIDWEKCKTKAPNRDDLVPFLKRLEFHSLVNELFSKGTFSVSKEETKKFSGKYETIMTQEELTRFIQVLESQSRIAIDVETTGLDVHKHELVGISFSWKKEFAAYIPLRHRTLDAPKQLDPEEVLKRLRPLFENPAIQKVGQNLKFDFSFLAQAGLRMKNLHFDTMIASYCLDPSRSSHRLKDLAAEFLGRQMTRIEELAPSISKRRSPGDFPMDQIPINEVSPYACADADCTLQLQERLDPLLKEKGIDNLFYKLEMPLVEILSEMEMTGIRVDTDLLEKLGAQFTEEISKLETKAHHLADQEFNLNSSKQLSFILFEKLKLPPVRKTKTGFSTDEEVLHTLSSSHELPQILLKHRELSKLKSTYIDGLLNQVHPESSKIHTAFNQTGTSTGRLSSSDPNLQNIPIRTEQGRMIRRAFMPEKGNVFLSADYSQIDLRVLCHLSGDPVLSAAFRQDADIHRATAAEVFHLKPEAVSEEQRKRAKAINFGIVYGQQSFGLSQSLGISMSDAQSLIESYFQKYAGVKDWIENIKKEAKEQGYVKTLLGRVRYLPEIHSKNGSIRAFAERMAMNTPVQGTSADIIKAAMITLHKKLQDSKELEAKMLVQVHDDLLFEVPKKNLQAAAQLVKTEMENAIQLSIPVLVDLKTGPNWADLKPLTLP